MQRKAVFPPTPTQTWKYSFFKGDLAKGLCSWVQSRPATSWLSVWVTFLLPLPLSIWAKCSASDCHSSNSMLLSCSCFFLIKRNEEGFCTCKINTNQNRCYSLIHSGLWSTSAFLFSHWECTAQEGLQREENRLPLPIWLTRFNAAIMPWKFITWERLWCGCPQCLGTGSFYLKRNQAPTVRGCVKSCLSWGRWNFHLM